MSATPRPAAYVDPFYAVECRNKRPVDGLEPHDDSWWCVGIYEKRYEAESSLERTVCTNQYEYRTVEVRIERTAVLAPLEEVLRRG